jgi:hypothetical protein
MAETSLKGAIITQAIAAIVFVGVPIVVTLMAPFTDLAFERTGATARVTVTRYVLVFIPWQTRQVDGVRQLRVDRTSQVHYRDTAEERRKGRANATSFATATLALVNGGPEVKVQVSPDLARETADRFDRFLASDDPEPFALSLYASRGLSYVLGGVATGFAALYLVGALLAIVTWPFKTMRRRVRTSS